MQAFSRRAPWQAAAVTAILAGGILGATPADAAVSVTTESLTWLWYATAQTPSSGAALSTAPLSGGAASYSTKALQTGVQDSMARMQGNSVEAIEFRSEPINRTLFFNLTGISPNPYVYPPPVPITPVTIVVNWATTLTGKTSTYSLDYSIVRAELLVGDNLVAGGDSPTNYIPISTGGYVKFTLNLFPEVTSLPAGEVLSLKLYRLGGFADFSVGTAKPQQTYIAVRGYAVDPLAGALYLEGSRLVANPFASSPTPTPSPEAYGAALLPFALAGFGRRRAAKAAVAALLVGALAGCLGSDATGSDPASEGDRPSLSATSEVREDLVRAGHGAIEGAVQDELGLAVRSAHLSLPGTSLFTDADGRGNFRFPNVTSGDYILRVDSPGYPPLEKDIRVRAGEVLRLLVTMAKAKSSNSNLDRHLHDDWGGLDQLPLIDEEILPASSGGQKFSSEAYYCVTANYPCDFKFFVPIGKVVPPGATRVEVVITLPSGSNADKEVSLSAYTGTTTRVFGARPSGQPFKVVFFPDESDRGHQKFSYWTFTAQLRPASGTYSTHGYPVYTTGGKAHIAVTAHRGVVPYEAPHKEPWGTQTRLPVVKNPAALYQSCYLTLCDFPLASYSFKPGNRLVVPAGTLEVRGTLSWQYSSNPTGDLVDWTLKYRTADIPPADWASNLKTPATIKPNATLANAIDFVIPVKAGEEDPFYATVSNWEFYPDDQSEPVAPNLNPRSAFTFGITMTMNAYAYRDPTWKI